MTPNKIMKVPEKPKKRADQDDLDLLYGKIGRIVCDEYPEFMKAWYNGDPEGKIGSTMQDIQLILKYARKHPRFIESLRTGLLK